MEDVNSFTVASSPDHISCQFILALIRARSCNLYRVAEEFQKSEPWKYDKVEELALNKHRRPAKSLLRLGLEMLRRVLKNNYAKNDQTNLQILLKVLSRT